MGLLLKGIQSALEEQTWIMRQMWATHTAMESELRLLRHSAEYVFDHVFWVLLLFFFDDILLQTILYNSHPGTPMPNICHFSDATISILIKSIASIFLNIFPILFLS